MRRAHEVNNDAIACYMRRDRLARSNVAHHDFSAGRDFPFRAGAHDGAYGMASRDELWNEASSDVAGSSGQQDGGARHGEVGVRRSPRQRIERGVDGF